MSGSHFVLVRRNPRKPFPAIARVFLVLWCIALFLTGFFLYTRHHTFPFEFHPDEAPKASRIIEGRPDYRQPLLFSTVTTLAARLGSQTGSVQQVVFTGRLVSAIFAASALVLFSLFAYAINDQSLRAALAVGLAALSCPQMVLLAHYMKEDTALVFGTAAFLLAVWHHDREPTPRSASLLGIATALIASGKYIGLAAIPAAHWLVATRSFSDKERRRNAFLLGLILAWCGINYLILANPLGFIKGLGYELIHPVAGHHGLANGVLLYSPVWQMLAAQLNPLVAILAVIYLLFLWLRNCHPVPRATLFFVLGPAIYLFCLSISHFVVDRHLLPVTLAIYMMACFGIIEITRLFRGGTARWTFTLMFAAALIGTAISPIRAIFHELENETRVQLRTWVRNNLPPTAVIAEDRPTHLCAPDAKSLSVDQCLPPKILTPRSLFVVDLESLDGLRSQGVTHIATCDQAYARLFTHYPITAAARKDYDRRRKRYEEIFSSATLLFEAKPARPVGGHTSPVVRLYAVPPASKSESERVRAGPALPILLY